MSKLREQAQRACPGFTRMTAPTHTPLIRRHLSGPKARAGLTAFGLAAASVVLVPAAAMAQEPVGDISIYNACVTSGVACVDHPIANYDYVASPDNQWVTIDVLANDVDQPSPVEQMAGGDRPLTVVGFGNIGGGLSYVPADDYNFTEYMPLDARLEDGQIQLLLPPIPTDHFKAGVWFNYVVEDAEGDRSAASAFVDVTRPTFIDPGLVDDTLTTDYMTERTLNVLDNDTIDPSMIRGSIAADSAAHGTLSIDQDGVVTYLPDEGWVGTETIDYTVELTEIVEGEWDDALPGLPLGANLGETRTFSATATLRTLAPSAPAPADDAASVAHGASGVEIDVLANDTYLPGTAVTATGVTCPTGTATISSGGVVTYTAGSNFAGVDACTYTVHDTFGQTGTARLDVTVAAAAVAPPSEPDPVVDPPVVVDDPLPEALSSTGATGVAGSVWAAAGLLSAGLALVGVPAWRRRRRAKALA
ncbi:Ig-like domain-containing protein [Demequina sp.]|uniref:Ig-like domain-containing protein n=1 Tax=Demequina sp. TaxID=2050685 RepID=UPI003D10D3C1